MDNLRVLRPDVVLFTTQVSIIFIVVCTSLVNLTCYDKNIELWTMILTSCLGYLMPNPRFKPIKEDTEGAITVGSNHGSR